MTLQVLNQLKTIFKRIFFVKIKNLPRFTYSGFVVLFEHIWRNNSVEVKEWFLYFGQLILSDVSIKISHAKVKAVFIAFF